MQGDNLSRFVITARHSDSESMRTYREKLTIEQIATGIIECLENAKTLIEDARALLAADRPARACFALLCADQELGKIIVLVSMAQMLPQDQARWHPMWKRFRGHEIKITYANMFGIPELAEPRFSSIVQLAEDWLGSAPRLENLRQRCLYVDYSKSENRWLSPREIGVEAAQSLLQKVVEKLHRALEFQQVGLFSVDALRIQHEELCCILEEATYLEETSALHTMPLDNKFLSVWRKCWRRLTLEGAVTLSDDYLIMNIPWRDFIAEKDF